MGIISDIVEGAGDLVSGAVEAVGDIGSFVDDAVNDVVPGGWYTLAGGALTGGTLSGLAAAEAGATGLASLPSSVLSADAAFGLGGGALATDAALAAGAAGTGAVTGTLASIAGLPVSEITSTFTNAMSNPLTSTAVKAGLSGLLGTTAQQLPGAIAGAYGANQYANNLADYATNLQTAAGQFGTTLTGNINNIASGLSNTANTTGNNLVGVAGTQGNNIINAYNEAGQGLLGTTAQQTANTTALAGKLAPTMQFTPVGMTTRFGSTTTPQYDANGKLIGYGYTVTPDIALQRDRLLALSNQALPQTTDIGQATSNYYNQLQALQNPQREQQLAALRAQLQSTGRAGLAFGATTGVGGANELAATNPEMAAYYNALAQQQSQQALTAQDVAQQRLNQQLALSSGLFGQAQTLEGAGQQAMSLGTNLGQLATAGATNAANLQMNAQQVAAAQNIAAQLQASGWSAQAAQQAALMQVQAATQQGSWDMAAAQQAAQLQAEAQRQASLQNLLAAQTGAGLMSQGSLAQSTATQQGLAGITPALGGLLSSGVNYLTGGTLSSLASPTIYDYGYNPYQPTFSGFDLNSSTPGLWADLSFD